MSEGLYEKFKVIRMDGKDAPGEKHHGCKYFVLDLDHDPHAVAAIAAYEKSCRQENPVLAGNLETWLWGQENYEGTTPAEELASLLSYTEIVQGLPGGMVNREALLKKLRKWRGGR